jgi:probable phosphomutase (TIGR03848 family)
MKRLLLLRHATTDHTGRLLTGWTPGVHLGERGRAEAQALAERLAPLEIHAIYSSPLERCMETATAVAEPRGLKVTIIEEVGEVRFGEWTGKELRKLARTDLWRVVQAHPSGARFPDGESIYEMQARAVLACERLREAHPDETVAVCSHADVIKAVAAHYLGMHLDLFQRIVVGTASVTAIGFGPVPYLLRLNDSGLTADLAPPAEPPAGDPAAADAPGQTAGDSPSRNAAEGSAQTGERDVAGS